MVYLSSVVGPLAFDNVNLDGNEASVKWTHLIKHMMNWMPAASACWTALSNNASPLAPVLRLGWPFPYN